MLLKQKIFQKKGFRNFMKNQIKVQEIEISISKIKEEDYISLTDMAKYKNTDSPDKVIQNWLKNDKTISFLDVWEKYNNPNFKPLQTEGLEILDKSFNFMSPKQWIEQTNAIGITSKRGRYGGTYAHKDIAFEFATWLSPEFKFYVIKEFQRLKENETDSEFQVQRLISKRNYKIQTKSIKENLIPELEEYESKNGVYASEADMLNLAVWGKTAKQWREENPEKPSNTNIRDFASIDELIVLSNLEVLNSKMIDSGIERKERFQALKESAIKQLQIFSNLKPIEL
jgi:hypothetical protein